eukprot:TRINITY_DN17424_c0_g1_i1.p1 TRINITY_DN17424_c0_g1~~TRINITY_DN17424_c0_g1_i1.p1  ORF type:complete len:413 (-),score=83.26 TRINITY_DN17424_c0_g1_i1:297-1535(-)
MPHSHAINYEKLTEYFHLPINNVAKELGVCATVLKKICRRNGIPRWPHRKIKSLDKMIRTLESTIAKTPEDEERIKQDIISLKNKKMFLMKNPKVLAIKANKEFSEKNKTPASKLPGLSDLSSSSSTTITHSTVVHTPVFHPPAFSHHQHQRQPLLSQPPSGQLAPGNHGPLYHYPPQSGALPYLTRPTYLHLNSQYHSHQPHPSQVQVYSAQDMHQHRPPLLHHNNHQGNNTGFPLPFTSNANPTTSTGFEPRRSAFYSLNDINLPALNRPLPSSISTGSEDKEEARNLLKAFASMTSESKKFAQNNPAASPPLSLPPPREDLRLPLLEESRGKRKLDILEPPPLTGWFPPTSSTSTSQTISCPSIHINVDSPPKADSISPLSNTNIPYSRVAPPAKRCSVRSLLNDDESS